MRNIGLFGGTFDPIHNGHLRIAEAAAQRGQLDWLIFLPAGQPPHKRSQRAASGRDRLEMTRLAVEGLPLACEVSDYEIASGRVNYTVDTLRHFKERFREDKLYFIIGADSFRDLPLWKDYVQIIRMVSLIVVSRPGVDKTALLGRFNGDDPAPHVLFVAGIQQHESSSAIRQRLRTGQPVSGMLPAAVEQYIKTNQLYTW